MARTPFARRALVAAVVAQSAFALVAPSSARAATDTFTPVADARVRSDQPAKNFGVSTTLVADKSPATESFLRFAVTGLTAAPTAARLRLWVTDKSSNGPQVRAVTSAWDEHTVTWKNRPSVGATVVANIGAVAAGKWITYDVSPLVTGDGPVDLALVGDSTDGADFSSREATAARRPQLVVDTGGIEPPPPPPPPSGGAYSFGVIGDTGYNADSVTKFLNVRSAMNQAGLDFSVHVGDFKYGPDPCPDSVYTTALDRFDGFDRPLVYTPGDNDWTDCADQLDRLAHLRQVLFAGDQSLGTPSMTVERQSAAYPENAMWQDGPVTFVTLHNIGPDNNAGQTSEFEPRNAANLDWLHAAFEAAKARGSLGVVILSHANPGFPDAASRASKVGFHSYLQKLVAEVQAWGKPVIYVHGDTHTFTIDHPPVLGTTLPNFTRVQVYGPSAQHWVRVDVDPASPSLFTIQSQ